MKTRAIALISGGLDSLLAARVIKEQGVKVDGVCFVMQFAARDLRGFKRNVRSASKGAGINVRFVDISEDFLEVLKAPEHGYGANTNPCIDCKILMLSKAREMMVERKADMVVTGEVLGERPMSQRRAALDIIEKESGLKGYLLRPLSARVMKETIPEEKGLVNREKLLSIKGRSREPQLALAGELGITKFFTPAGGCLLTYPGFSRRIRDLLDNGPLTGDNVKLLKTGRHFRLDEKTKVIIGKDEKENAALLRLAGGEDIVLRLWKYAGPYALLRGDTSRLNLERAAGLVAGHSKYRGDKAVKVEYWIKNGERRKIDAAPVPREEIDRTRI